MYAIVKNGSRQLKVREGDMVLVDNSELAPGEDYAFDNVLLYSDEAGSVQIGSPALGNVTVSGTVVREATGPKLVVFTYRKRKSSQRRKGHRQHYSEVRIKSIQAG